MSYTSRQLLIYLGVSAFSLELHHQRVTTRDRMTQRYLVFLVYKLFDCDLHATGVKDHSMSSGKSPTPVVVIWEG